ncbi:alpha/beta hydrolase [Caenibacillus caldisaponilyticus]|uniref:alpha/beta hydrolase n=1 Tax=Caenibacillus caldisaponilyticus TaxID=1674942 RepID=UPI000988561E|nr:carboxylesterase [Caenibacillus caldisaponilyticus]
MKIVPPKPFTFKAGKRAVLLLHGFTGNSSDVRMLGRFLEKKGYTCHAPHYKGHGVPPEELLNTGPDDWWQDVLDAYHFLKDLGYDEIAVCGLSLGGVFSLKLGYTLPVKGIVPMCAPATAKTREKIYAGVLKYAREWKQLEGKNPEQVEKEMQVFYDAPMDSIVKVSPLIEDVRRHLDLIYAPIFVVQARHDEMIDPNSANIIYNEVQSVDKRLKFYENSTHVITLGAEKETLHQDIYEFLESLDWSVS